MYQETLVILKPDALERNKACIEKDDRLVQKQVAKAAGTTEVTLRNRLRCLETLFAQAPVLAD